MLIAAAPGEALVPDVEGVTLLTDGPARYLIASSQGDSAFPVWRVDGAEPVYQGRFSVAANGHIDAVTGTDGIAAGGGLIVVQDDVDSQPVGAASDPERQNFKVVTWAAVKAGLRIAP